MGIALTYATKQRDKLESFCMTPSSRSTTMSRSAHCGSWLGRKKSLFAGAAEHARNLAIIQSIIATCRLHAVNPYDYIRHMLIEIQSHPAARMRG